MRQAYFCDLLSKGGLTEEVSVRRVGQRTMELNQVSYFINLAETLNFTAAARLSGVSQPSPVSYTHLDVYKRQVKYYSWAFV